MSRLFSRPREPDPRQVEAARAAALPLSGGDDEFDDLLRRIGNARFVLLGEASHGTHEFYEARARITLRLIAERGFAAVAIEGDWPDAYRVNRYVRGLGADRDAAAALEGFQRFPTWMWRNTAVVEFVERLRDWNHGRPNAARTGFYGLDLYSLNASMSAVLGFLDREAPEVAARARERYACFEPFGGDSQAYGLMTGLGSTPSCEEGVIRTLLDLQQHRARKARRRRRSRGAVRRGAERRAGARRRALLPDDVSERGVVMERARHPHGAARCGRSTATCRARAGRPGSSCGRTTPTWATRASPKWARRAANSTWASWCASACPRTAIWSASRRTTAPSPPPASGTRRPSTSASIRRAAIRSKA